MPMHHSPSASPTRRRHHGLNYIVHHQKYYLPGGDLYVLINGVMFKIHSYFFNRESTFFVDVSTSADPTSATDEEGEKGKSEDRAIRFLDVTVEEFEQFLWVFYNPTYDIYDADVQSWFSILKLAHRWDFPVVKDFALRELKRRETEIPLVTRIKLYQDNEAPPEYLVALFSQLCSREFGPTDEETVELGLEQTCRVWRAREMLRSPGGSSPLPSIVTQKDTYAIVSGVMDLPAYQDQTDEQTVADGVQPGAPAEADGPPVAQGSKKTKKNKNP
ncbi:hypothetical protein FA13DRAFT_1779197 [Coprinellus micaceus]|uniref:BTB domain-containing protein n=1 Tax=Coprinellus micaceus TaxID=71717 RepID=A0A4Y7SIF3_COPMI|nr:hypothetical protein FA13DRAFT_1779197 [Coprinellus micaceus]